MDRFYLSLKKLEFYQPIHHLISTLNSQQLSNMAMALLDMPDRHDKK